MSIATYYDKTAVISALSIMIGLFTIKVALDNFKGLNGDCIGAVAEVTRASSLVIYAIFYADRCNGWW